MISNSERIMQYMKNAKSRFEQLPAHPDVDVQIDRFNAVLGRLNASNKKLAEIKSGLMGVVNKGGGAEYKADFDRLKEINQMYGNPDMIQTRPAETIEILKQLPNVKAERARIAEKYADLMNQPTTEAKDMKSVLAYFDEVFGRFNQAATRYADAAPAEINAALDRVLELAKTGVENKRPAYFGPEGGVQQALNDAQTKVDVFNAIRPGDSQAQAAAERLTSVRAEAAQIGKQLEADILANNRVPAEQYNGPDKAQLIELMKAKWAAEGTGKEVLAIGMNSLGWKRDTRWEWNNSGWYKIDKSKTQGFVVAKLDDKTAGVWYFNFVKDHLAEDRIVVNFFQDISEGPGLIHTVLLENVSK